MINPVAENNNAVDIGAGSLLCVVLREVVGKACVYHLHTVRAQIQVKLRVSVKSLEDFARYLRNRFAGVILTFKGVNCYPH